MDTASAFNPRQLQILEALAEEDFLTVENLAQRFGVTTQTIRRDVNSLRDRGLLQRLHTGIRRIEAVPSFASRASLSVPEKIRLAERVSTLIPEGSSVSIGIGTTLVEVARALGAKETLKVVTNNLVAATHLWDRGNIELSVCGGMVTDRAVVGDDAVHFFHSYKVDYAIFGVAGVDEDGALLDLRHVEARARTAMAESARQTILILDASKFGRRASARAGWLWDADIVVTNGDVPRGLHERLSQIERVESSATE